MKFIRYLNTPFFNASVSYPNLRDELDRLFDRRISRVKSRFNVKVSSAIRKKRFPR